MECKKGSNLIKTYLRSSGYKNYLHISNNYVIISDFICLTKKKNFFKFYDINTFRNFSSSSSSIKCFSMRRPTRAFRGLIVFNLYYLYFQLRFHCPGFYIMQLNLIFIYTFRLGLIYFRWIVKNYI